MKRYLIFLFLGIGVMVMGGCSHVHYHLVLGEEGKADCQLKAGPAGGDVSCFMSGPLTFSSHNASEHVDEGEVVSVEVTEEETTIVSGGG